MSHEEIVRMRSSFPRRASRIIASCALTIALAFPFGASAQIVEGGTIVAGYLAGKKADQILQDFKTDAQGLIDSGTASGHALMTRAGNEGNVLVANTQFQLNGVLDKTFDQLNESQKQLLIEAENFRLQMNKTTAAAYDIKDTTVIDLNQIVDRVPFVQKTLFVQKVRGDAFLPTAGDFDIYVYAPIGVQSEEVDRVQVLRNGVPLNGVTVDMTTQRGIAHITIPNSDLASNFNDTKLTVVPIVIRISADRKNPWWNLVNPVQHLAIDAPISLAFYPHLAATLVVNTKVPVYDWRTVDVKHQSLATPNRNCTHKCHGEPTRGPNHIEFAVPGGPPPLQPGYERLVSPTMNCVGGNCAFKSDYHTALTDNNTRAYVDWDTWSTPGTYELSAQVQEYQKVGEQDAPPVGPILLRYDTVSSLLVRKDRTDTVVDVTTFTKKHYQLTVGQADPVVNYKSTSDAGVDAVGQPLARITYETVDPTEP